MLLKSLIQSFGNQRSVCKRMSRDRGWSHRILTIQRMIVETKLYNFLNETSAEKVCLCLFVCHTFLNAYWHSLVRFSNFSKPFTFAFQIRCMEICWVHGILVQFCYKQIVMALCPNNDLFWGLIGINLRADKNIIKWWADKNIALVIILRPL